MPEMAGVLKKALEIEFCVGHFLKGDPHPPTDSLNPLFELKNSVM